MRPPHGDVESGLAWQSRSETDLSSIIPEEVDPEKRSAEDMGRSSTDTSDAETGRGGPDQLSQQRTKQDEGMAGNGGVLSRVVSRVITRASTKSIPGPPPDGGLQAWMAGKCDVFSALAGG